MSYLKKKKKVVAGFCFAVCLSGQREGGATEIIWLKLFIFMLYMRKCCCGAVDMRPEPTDGWRKPGGCVLVCKSQSSRSLLGGFSSHIWTTLKAALSGPGWDSSYKLSLMPLWGVNDAYDSRIITRHDKHQKCSLQNQNTRIFKVTFASPVFF